MLMVGLPDMDRAAAPGRWWTFAAAALLLAAYAAMVGFFRLADVFHAHYFQISPALALAYNAARLTLGLLFFWSCIGLGHAATRGLGLTARRGPEAQAVTGLERLLLDFFVGGILLGCFWYALGLLGLLRWHVAVGVQALVLLVGAPLMGGLLRSFAAWAAPGRRAQAARQAWKTLRKSPVEAAGRAVHVLLVLLAGGFMLAAFALNALVPGGTEDVNIHYFPYLVQVLTTGTTFPGAGSNVWYHFYYTKSQGLFFAAALLSDPLAPQIISGVYAAAAGLCVYALLRMPLLPRALPLAGLIAFSAAFLTNANFIFHQKNHIVMLGNLAGLLWLCTRLWQAAPGFTVLGWKNWRLLAVYAMLGAGCILNAPSAFAVSLPLAGGLLVFALPFRARRAAAPGLFALCAGLCLGLGLTFLINYGLTGMAEINPLRVFWRHANLAALSKVVSPYLMVLLDQGSGEVGNLGALRLKALFKAHYHARIFKPAHMAGVFALTPLVAAALCGAMALRPADAGMRAVLRRLRETALPSLLWIVVIVAVGLGTRQEESYVRFTGFAMLPLLVLAMCFWQLLLCGPALHPRLGGLVTGCFALVLAANCLATVPERLPQEDRDAAEAFLAGRFTIAQQYSRLDVLWPPAHEIRAVIPKDARVRLMHIGPPTASMAPYAPMETDINFSLRGDWHVVMFSPAEQARARLEAQRLDYFLFDTSRAFFDLLIQSPLFAPESLQRNFKVLWRNGDVFLLTWADPGQAADPSPDMRDLLDRWPGCMAYSEKQRPTKALYDRVRHIYEASGNQTFDIRSPAGLEQVKGWQ